MLRRLSGVTLFLGLTLAVAGVAYAVNGATQAGAHVTVPVEVRTTAGLNLPVSVRGDSTHVPLASAETGKRIQVGISGIKEGGLEADAGSLELRSWGSTVAEQLLSRADVAVLGLSIGAGALLLRRLLLSIAEGEPFRRGNAVRVAGVAVLTVVGSYGAALTSGLAAGLVLDRIGLAGAGSPVTTTFSFPAAPLLVALLLLALAEAFRRGGELAQDVDGLV